MSDNNIPTDFNKRAARSVLHDTPVHFRAAGHLLDAAKALADARGMSFAELIRQALRHQIEAADKQKQSVETAPYRLTQQPSPMKRAAAGDLHAQRELITESLLAGNCNPAIWSEAIMEAETWARIAAANGGDQDYATLVSILGLRISDAKVRGDSTTSRRLEAEGIAMVSVLADEGNEDAAAMLPVLSQEADAELMTSARAMVKSWKAAV